MRKSIAAAALAASLAGGAAGAVLGAPGLAGAAETATGKATGAAGWVKAALSGLVSDGTITQDQADKVATALREAKPDRGPRGHMRERVDFTAVANVLGISPEEMKTALRDGKTLADLAADNDVDLDKVIDAMVAEHAARLDEKVKAGTLTQDEADAKLAKARERATAFANGEKPEKRFKGPRGDTRRDAPEPAGFTA